ncbi:alpha/beta hydrolase [Paenibacillus xylanilyticus]|uniref:Alpha/beta hydrolase n=1 Tax=Paenibacillus xylanilyticus TaxID=248903 RepID=A0A7Y6EZ68_9BACL|nr:alpha/beta hydrolase [Paenibacillus xylanilyticus]NUU79300.1 alpha/beta hydrolase [Paenibacillus xylanilyticus]
MKVTKKMIDRQLRFKGRLIDLLLKSSSEEKWVESMVKFKIRSDKSGGKIKDIEGITCSEMWIPRQNSDSKIRILIYRPANHHQDLPGVLWIHGGGYAMGNPEQFVHACTRLIRAKNCVVIAPDYRLSVEAKYPAALEDCYDTLLWMKNQAKELGIRDDQLMVGGESAGGGLTAALTLYARDKGEVKIAFQMPLYPMIDNRNGTESAKDNNAPIWNSNYNKWAWKLYLGELAEDAVPPYAAAARASDYSNLPPTVTFVGDIEPFRDETIQYVDRLRKAGVSVEFEIYKGCYHGFDIINPNAEVSKKATAFYINAFKYAVDHYFVKQNV